MGNIFSFIYSRPFRLILIFIEMAAVFGAIFFVASANFDLVWKLLLSLLVMVALWEAGLALSLVFVTKEGVDRIITIMMRTTRRFAFRPYVFVIDTIVYLLAAVYISNLGNIALTMLSSFMLIALIGDKMNSLYMSFIITQIADNEESNKKPKKRP